MENPCNEVLTSLFDFVFPRYCTVCGKRLLSGEEDLCLACRADIPYTYLWKEPSPWVLSLFYYNDVSPYRKLALSVKYMGNSGLGVRLGRLLGIRAAGSPSLRDGIDAVAPVPLHWSRKWKRGYNQSEKIAEGFVEGYGSTGAGTPLLLPRLLQRNRRTASQTGIDAGLKSKNVEGAFSPGAESVVLGRLLEEKEAVRVLIIDDTCTSGATLLACAGALKPYGPNLEILFASVAKVRED